MTTPTLEDLLRRAALNPNDASTLRPLAKELIRQGYNDPPRPTNEQIRGGARQMASIFQGIPEGAWGRSACGGLQISKMQPVFRSGLPVAADHVRLRIAHAGRNPAGYPLFVFEIDLEEGRGRGFYPPFEAAIEAKDDAPRDALLCLRRAIDPGCVRPSQRVPIEPQRAGAPDATPDEKMRAWRTLFDALNGPALGGPASDMPFCPRCMRRRVSAEISLDRPLCVQCVRQVLESATDQDNRGVSIAASTGLAYENAHSPEEMERIRPSFVRPADGQGSGYSALIAASLGVEPKEKP